MKLLIISDLHFDEQNDWDFINRITENMIRRVKNKLTENEEIIIVVLGDIINCGGVGNNDKKFSEADKFLENIKSVFSNAKFLFVPGNHEILKNSFDLTPFNDFCQRHSYKKEFIFTMDKSVFSVEEAGINLILVDTTLTRDHDSAGKMDIESLKTHMRNTKNIIFMHHPPCPKDGADRSIVNSKELIATYSNFIFYGHQHGRVKVPDFLEGDTDIHSVGTLLKQESGSKNELILLDISNGKINFAYRYIYSGESFVANLLFPLKKDLKSEYLSLGKPEKIETSILRKLKRISDCDNNTDNESSVWQKLIGENIDTVVKEHNCLLLVGDAGIGKSFEMANIYWNYEKHEEYFPIWLNLRNTNYETIKVIISYAQLNTIDRKLPLLIIDGLDEMAGDNITNLRCDIGAAIYGNPEVRIILSARANFKITIDGFTKFMILPLERKEILEIASRNSIDNVETFWQCLNTSGCLSLAKVPFYLVDIIHIYSESGSLPERSQLLDRMIYFRFKKADERYNNLYKNSILGNEYEVRSLLKKLGFFMQTLHKYSLSNDIYTHIFKTRERTFLNKTGLISLKDDEHGSFCEFDHNIFREYLVAVFLRAVKFEDLIKIITYDEEGKKLRPSWVNVVAFLLPLRDNDDLKQWLIHNAIGLISEFESDRFEESERNDIFKTIMEDCFQKDLPIYSLYNEQKVAQYFQSKATINYMISLLQSSTTMRTYLSVLHILCYCSSFYGREDELKDIILKMISLDPPEYIVTSSIKALANIYRINLRIISTDIYSLLENDYRPDVVAAFCDLLVKANLVDEYADYIFDILEKYKMFSSCYGNLSSLSNAIRAFTKLENITKAIGWFCISKNSNQYYENNQLFLDLISHLLLAFQNDGTMSLDNIVLDFATVCGKCDTQKSKMLKRFFTDIDKLSDAFELLLKLKLPKLNMVLAIENIMEETLVQTLIESYYKNKIDADIFKWYAKRLPQDSSIFIKLNDAALKKEGNAIQKDEVKDWNKINKDGDQKYFDSLFSREQFSKLVHELLGFYGEQVLCGELLGNSFSKVVYRQDMQNTLTACYHWGKNDWKVSKFIDLISWSSFSISEICRILQNRSDIEVSDKEIHAINTYCQKTISEIDFESLDENNAAHNVMLWQTERVIFLLQRFHFMCSDKKLLEFLILPWWVFSSRSSSSESSPLHFVAERISNPQILRQHILGNINKKSIPISSYYTHILYCLENKLPDAIDLAIELFRTDDASVKWRKPTAIDYLIMIRGNKFVDDLIDDNTENELLVYLASKLVTENKNLISKLIARNKYSENRMLFLRELIKLNVSYGLETYIELAEKVNALPDFNTDSNRIPEVTEAIRWINDISLINQIAKLMEICYSNGFKDNDNFGLRGSLHNAIYNLIQVDRESVRKMLLNLIEYHKDNNDLKSICNWYLHDIIKISCTSSDLAWPISKAHAVYESIRSKAIF